MGRSRHHSLQTPQAEQPQLRKRKLSATIMLKKAVGQMASLAVSTAILSAVAVPIRYLPVLAQESAPSETARATYPTLTTGSTGESVSELQSTLKLLGFYQGAVDGTYSQPTLEAVTRFQTAAGIAADGITGPSTWQKLLPVPSDITAVAEAPAIPQPAATAVASSGNPAPLGPPILRAEAAGPAVAQLQRELQELGYYSGPIDGGFGAQTQASVEKFQADQQLFVDGVVGPSTWDALSGALDK